MNARAPVKIDAEFEAEARAMARAMATGELPATDAPYYQRVKGLAELHVQEKIARAARKAARP